MKRQLFIFLLLFCFCNLQAQDRKGTVINQSTNKPVPECLVIIKGKTVSFVTDEKGEFYLPSQKSFLLVFTLLGYATIEYDLSTYKKDTFYISPKSIQLKEVAVASNKKNILNPNNPESILDFDFLNNDLILLTAGEPNNNLRLTDENGKTIAVLKVNKHSDKLKHDCIGNLDLFSSDSVWQVFYDYIRLNALKPYSLETYYRVLGKCVCVNNKNYYFQSSSYRNLRSNYFYYNEDAKGQRNELIAFQDTNKIRNFELDYNLQYFLDARRKSNYTLYNEPVDSIKKKMEQYREALPLDWTYNNWLGKMESQMIKADTSTFIINFTDTAVYAVSVNNQVKYKCRLNAYKNKDLLPQIYVDGNSRETYLAGYSGSTLTIIKFDIDNGKEISRTEIANVPYLPKKIIINSGNAFFVQKNLADEQICKMIKYYLN